MVVSSSAFLLPLAVESTLTDSTEPAQSKTATLTAFTETDKDWPRFMRVHPILDWSYADIWTFLRHPSLTLGEGSIEWCEMYNYGFVQLPVLALEKGND